MCGLLDLYKLRAPGCVARGQAGCWDFWPDYLRGPGMPGEGELWEGRDELSGMAQLSLGGPLDCQGRLSLPGCGSNRYTLLLHRGGREA